MVFLTLSVHGKRSTSPPERRAYENKEAVAATGKKKREELGTMTEENYQKLQNIGFEFEWQNLRYSFDQRTDHLAEYKKQYGHCSVPTSYSSENNLGAWAGRMRHKYNAGSLPKDKVEKLNEVGFVWSVGKYGAVATSTHTASHTGRRQKLLGMTMKKDTVLP